LISSLRHGATVTIGLIAGIGGSGYLLARTGRRWLIAREQVAADDDRYGGFSEPWKTAVDLKREGIKEPATMFNAGGRRQHPKPSNGENNREKWRQDTKGLRDALASDYKRRYAQSGIAPNQLHWLMTWYAKQAKERWKRGALREDRESLRRAAPRGALVLLWAG